MLFGILIVLAAFIFTISLCKAVKNGDEQPMPKDNGCCEGCFGAANNDCWQCQKKERNGE